MSENHCFINVYFPHSFSYLRWEGKSGSWFFHLIGNQSLSVKIIWTEEKRNQVVRIPGFFWQQVVQWQICLPMPGDAGLILGLGRSLGVGNGNPLHYSCLGNPMDFLMGYSLWSRKNQAQLSTNTHTHTQLTRHKESHSVIQRECLRNKQESTTTWIASKWQDLH